MPSPDENRDRERRSAVLELVAEAIDDGATWVVVKGSCMEPWIVDGDRIRVAPLDPPAAVGDVVLARDGDDTLVCHRVLGFEGESLHLAGDRTMRLDVHAPESVLGRVIAVQRGEKVRRVRAAGFLDRLQARLHRWVRGRLDAPWVVLLEAPRRLIVELRALTWRLPD